MQRQFKRVHCWFLSHLILVPKPEVMSHTKAHQLERTIVVVGATGIQGSGVVQALLSDGRKSPWFVRALTQDPDSSKAEALLSKYQTDDKRLSLVSGHVYDEASLRAAFAGAYGVFAMTSERHPNKVITEEADMQHELEAGRNIISAAKHCGIRHLVYSSLPDVVKASKGQFQRIHHMDNKYTIEQMARKDLDGFTALIPGTCLRIPCLLVLNVNQRLVDMMLTNMQASSTTIWLGRNTAEFVVSALLVNFLGTNRWID